MGRDRMINPLLKRMQAEGFSAVIERAEGPRFVLEELDQLRGRAAEVDRGGLRFLPARIEDVEGFREERGEVVVFLADDDPPPPASRAPTR